MVLADLGRKITTALRSLSTATVINEEVTFVNKNECTCFQGSPCLGLALGLARERLG